jgi:hypothetical protein
MEIVAHGQNAKRLDIQYPMIEDAGDNSELLGLQPQAHPSGGGL